MATHPGAWLMKYAIWMCVVAITPQILITTRAFVIFKECRINLAYWWDLARFKQLGSCALWQMFGGLGYIFRNAMRGRIAAVGCSFMGAGSIGGKNYCGNLLWQSSVTLLPPPRNDHLDDSRNCCRSIPRFRILPQTCRKYDTLYTI